MKWQLTTLGTLYVFSQNTKKIAMKKLLHLIYEGVSKSFRTESITKYTLTNNKHSLKSNTRDYEGKTH